MDYKEWLKTDEGKAAIQPLIAQAINDYEKTEVAGLKKNRDDALKEKDKLAERLKKFEGIDPDKIQDVIAKAQKAEEDRMKSAGEWEKLDEQRKIAHQKEIDKLTKQIEDLKKANDNFLVETSIGAAIREAKIAPHAVDLVSAYVGQKIAIVDVDGKRQVRVGDDDVSNFLKKFVESDDGKHYTLADTNTGGNASGGGGFKNAGSNPWAKDSFNVTEQMKIKREKPDLAKRLQAQAGQ